MTQQQFNLLYQQAKKLMQKTKDPIHEWLHIQRVIVNIFKIKKLLSKKQQEKIDDKILIIACTWHDISYVFYKAGFIQYFLEGKRCARISRKYFKQVELCQNEVDLMCDVILHHPLSSFKILNKKRSLYHQTLQDADFLDMFSPQRIKQSNEHAEDFLYWRFVVKILKPLFFNYVLKNKRKFLNLKQSM